MLNLVIKLLRIMQYGVKVSTNSRSVCVKTYNKMCVCVCVCVKQWVSQLQGHNISTG